MGSSSSIMRPQELAEFRKLNTSVENVEIPTSPENRTLTDKKGFVLFGIAIVILIPFLIYTLVKSDFRHITNGSDDCGNFCGIKNSNISGIPCSGKDFTNKRYLEGNYCVESCKRGTSLTGKCLLDFDTEEFERELDRALKKNFDDSFKRQFNKRSIVYNDETSYTKRDLDISDAFEESRDAWWKYLLTIILTIAIGIFTLVLLRFAPAPFVWGIIIFSMVVVLVVTGGLWYFYFQVQNSGQPELRENARVFLALVVFWTIIAAIVLIVFIVLFKRIGLVVQLYKETTKVLAAMPLLVFVPVVTTFVQIIVFLAAVTTTVCMFFSLELVKYSNNMYIYELTGVAVFTIIFNIFVSVWIMRFIGGIQYMTISGSVVRWYFCKNKDNLGYPICSSLKVTMRYHLGTVAFGSLLMTLFVVVKAILRIIFRNACCRCIIDICCSQMEIILKFLSENSYIQTAIHGQSYLRSAKRATKLLLTNAASVIAINCVGDFVLGIIVFFVTLLATAISYALFMNLGPVAAFPISVCFIINIIIISIIFGTFQNIIDTLFICFCEDSVLNDGMSRPYYMSRGLMEFVENSKKVYDQKNGR